MEKIKIQNLNKIYKPKKQPEVRAINNVSLTFGDRGLVFVVGKSGCGKSTFLNLLGGLDSITSGDIIVDGKSLGSLSIEKFNNYRNYYVGFVFQEYNLLENLTVGENLQLSLELQGKLATSDEIDNALNLVELKGYAQRRANELSGGQKQRVSLARALIKSPQIILADEPTGNLDSETNKQLFLLLKNIAKNRLVIVVSHDMDSARLYGDRIIKFTDGKVGYDNILNEENLLPLDESVNNDNLQLNDDKKLNEKGKINNKKSSLKFDTLINMGTKMMLSHPIRMTFTTILLIFSLVFLGIGLTTASLDAIKLQYRLYKNESIINIAVNENISNAQFDKLKNDFSNYVFNQIYDASDYGIRFDNTSNNRQNNSFNQSTILGIVSVNDNTLNELGCNLLVGNLPQNQNEIVLSKYLADYFVENGIYNSNDKYKELNSYNDVVDTKVTIDVNYATYVVTICGIVDTGLNIEEYEMLKSPLDDMNLAKKRYDLVNKFNKISKNLHQSIFVNKQFMHYHMNEQNAYFKFSTGHVNGESVSWQDNQFFEKSSYNDILLSNATLISGIESLGENDVLLEKSILINYYKSSNKSLFNGSNFDDEISDSTLIDFLSNGAKLEIMRTFYESIYELEPDEVEFNEYNIVGFISYSPNNISNYGKITSEPLPKIIFSEKKFDAEFNKFQIINSVCTKYINNKKFDISLISYIDADENYQFNMFHSSEVFGVIKLLQNIKKVGANSSIVFILFALLMMYNYMSNTIYTNKKNIGILSAMGVSNSNIYLTFFVEVFIISVVSALVGIILSIVSINYINDKLLFNEVLVHKAIAFAWYTPILLVFASFLTATIGSIMPIINILRQKPVEIIRSDSKA